MKQLNLIMALGFLISSCNGNSKPANFLVSIEPIAEYTVKEIKDGLLPEWNGFAVKIRYGVSALKMIYRTSYEGKMIRVSGLVFIPENPDKPLPVISVQHGTIFTHELAPSNNADSYSEFKILAATGYVAYLPDYIGYAESKDIFHPYYDYKSSSAAVIDMIRAGRELLGQEGLAANGKIYLTGYSEGGYVTLAAHKKMESDTSLGLKVSASAAGAGGFDLLGVLNEAVVKKEKYPAPAYLAFILMAYNNTYHWNRPLKDFFNSDVAETLPEYIYGKHSGYSVNGALPTALKSLFNPAFYKALQGRGEDTLKTALAKNSVHAWKARAPVLLYHGTKDEVIPYASSVTTRESLKESGSGAVHLFPIEGGSHGTSYYPMLVSFFNWLEQEEGN